MFRKPFKLKNQSAIKGSDRKKLRADVGRLFPQLSPEELGTVIPNKEDITTTKICTHSGENGVVYCLSKNPIFFEINRKLLPTVYLLWQFPDLLPVFTTWPPVYNKLTEGADLMLPGVVVHGEMSPSTFSYLGKGDPCAICLVGNRASVAVGITLMSGEDMFQSGMRGKGVHPIHLLGDELWSFGDKSQPPLLADPTNAVMPSTDIDESCGDTGRNCEIIDMQVLPDMDCLKLEPSQETSVDGNSRSSTPVSLSDSVEDCDGDDPRSPIEKMDDVLMHCFQCAVKGSLKKSDLPLLTSAFYKNHMMPYCHSGQILDIKKSSYKKLSKFLRAMQSEGYIKVKELNKGVDSVTEFDKSHPGLRNFCVPEMAEAEKAMSGDCESVNDYEAPEIVDMFSVNTAVLPVLSTFGYRKGNALSPEDVRKILTEYVKNNQLQSEGKRSHVVLDPVLAHLVLNKDEGDVSSLKWEEFFSRFLSKMQASHQITFPGQQPITHKGKIEPITIDVVRRAGNKKVTLIDQLEFFGINPEAFAHAIQIGVACSTSINPSTQKGRGMQVLVQGNQLNFIANLLTEKYKINKKFIQVAEKAVKSVKKR